MMNAIILAAGEGTRLRPLTSDRPKCLVRLFGKTLLQWQIEVLRSCGIADITIVTGYRGDKITVPGAEVLENRNYDTTNMVESLFCAREKLRESTLVSYGDIIYQQSVLRKLMASPDDISVVVDKRWRCYWEVRFDNPLDDAESLEVDGDGYILSIGQKAGRIEDIAGQYIGLMKFQSDGIRALKSFYDAAKRCAAAGTNPLKPGVPFEKSFMTDLLHGLIQAGSKIRAVPVENGWLELDSLRDYEIYNRMKADRTLGRFFCGGMD
jgi:choline kinase